MRRHVSIGALCLAVAAAVLGGCAQPYLPPEDLRPAPPIIPAMQAGDDAMRRGDVAAAIGKYIEARAQAPSFPLPLYGLATAYDRLGACDVIALACCRGYLAALPVGRTKDIGLVLGRIEELDQHAVARIDRLVRRGRDMVNEIPAERWVGGDKNRTQALQALDAAAARIRGGPPPRDPNSEKRGQPSLLAEAEIASWNALADRFRADPRLADPAAALRSENHTSPEQSVWAVALLASNQADALVAVRDLERQWQTKWAVAFPPP
jgi:hypothetical protein